MYRVCLDKFGKLIEAQSGKDGGLQVLLDNAASAGLTNVQVKLVTDAEYAVLLQAAPRAPQEATAQDVIAILVAKGVITDADVKANGMALVAGAYVMQA